MTPEQLAAREDAKKTPKREREPGDDDGEVDAMYEINKRRDSLNCPKCGRPYS